MTTRRAVAAAIPAGSPQALLAGFISRYSPAVAADGKAALVKLRRLIPGATELVYDTYNWLVVGFGPSERASDAVLSVVFAPRWITVCFLQNGPELPDPERLLRGSGKVVRNIRLESARDLDTPSVKALVKAALEMADVPIPKTARRRLVIRSVSAQRRPRRPV